MPTLSLPKLFIAYAHENEGFKNALLKRLKNLKRDKEIDVWHDAELTPGDEWRRVRDQYLASADMVLYLASPESIDSDEVNHELAKALDDNKIFIPIILRPCDWKSHPIKGEKEAGERLIAEFLALPKDGKPITSWDNQDEAWQNVIDGIRRKLNSMREAPISREFVSKGGIAEAFFNLANAKFMLGAFKDALQDYSEAIKLKPGYASAYDNRGSLFFALNRHDEALADYTKAIKLEPDEHSAYNGRGIVLYALNRHDEALADFSKAIKLEPDDPLAYNNRGNVFSALNRYDEALADFNKAMALKHDNALAYYNRGRVFYELGQRDKAVQDVKTAKELFQKQGDQAGILRCDKVLRFLGVE